MKEETNLGENILLSLFEEAQNRETSLNSTSIINKDKLIKQGEALLEILKEENINWDNKKRIIEVLKELTKQITNYRINLQEKDKEIFEVVIWLDNAKENLEINTKLLSEKDQEIEKLKYRDFSQEKKIKSLEQKKEITKRIYERKLKELRENDEKQTTPFNNQKTNIVLLIVLSLSVLALILLSFFLLIKLKNKKNS